MVDRSWHAGLSPAAGFVSSPTSKASGSEIAVAEVEPLLRQLSRGVFNDSPEFGTARERVVSILTAFREDVPLPPIEMVRAEPGSSHRFRLSHGAHRFYCAIAAGFSPVPATDVTDELAKIGPLSSAAQR